MGITRKTERSKISPEKLKEVVVHWGYLNQLSQKAIEDWNRIAAKAQLRACHELQETK